MTIQGLSYNSGQPVEYYFEDGKVAGFKPLADAGKEKLLIGPGFTDLQVNGFGGHDYNELATDPARVAAITHGLFREGVTTHLATVITNRSETISQLIRQILVARSQDQFAAMGVAGIHLEGPFISPIDGPRGAHPKEFVCAPNSDLFKQWQEAAGGTIRMITLSPEWENAIPFIEFCRGQGVLVAIGHTNATHRQIDDAIRAGATLSTHLGNGMHPILERHPNYLWSQLADDRLSATIIADGFHLAPEVIRVFQKVKKEKLMLISDAVSLAGKPAGNYELHIGGKVTLTSEGRLHLQSNTAILAGAVVSIAAAVSNLVRNQIVSLPEAWDMASVRPQRFLNPSSDLFAQGAAGDFIVAQMEASRLVISRTVKGGRVVYSA